MNHELSILRPPHPSLPRLVAHADWGTTAAKRQMALAVRDDGYYHLLPPESVGELDELPPRLKVLAGESETTMLGLDFPIGLPAAYAAAAGVCDFLDALPRFGTGDWCEFYEVAETAGQISVRRPFYPARPGGSSHEQLLQALGLGAADDLYRRCDRSTADRGAASPLFWTLGAKQVGKAAISGWRDLLVPGLAEYGINFAIWPFAGTLRDLIRERSFVVVESYPAEAYRHLGFPRSGWSKRQPSDRRTRGVEILAWAAQRPVICDGRLVEQIRAGFGDGPEGEDAFDAVMGLLQMIDVVLNYRSEGVPQDDVVRRVEGWIFGQQGQAGCVGHGLRPITIDTKGDSN